MIRREKLQALVMSRRSVGEADRLVTLFTRELGLVRVLAKGVRRIPSRRGGHMESLTQVLVLISGSSGRYFLRAVETENYFRVLHKDREALAIMQSLAHLVVNLFEEEVPYPRLYDAVHQACEVLPQVSYVKRSLVEVAIVLMALREGGVLPLLDKCLRCGQGRPREAVVLDAQRGGWVCLTHLPTRQAGLPTLKQARASLTPRVLAALRYLSVSPSKALNLSIDEEEAHQLLEATQVYVSAMTMREMAA